jgi:serine protease AprX
MVAESPPPAWREWILLALSDLGGSGRWAGVLSRLDERFGYLFTTSDRQLTSAERPRWQARAAAARRELVRASMLRREGLRWALTADGDREAARLARPPLVPGHVLAPPLLHESDRRRIGFPVGEDARLPVVFELNTSHPEGVDAAFARLTRLWTVPAGVPAPRRVSEQYVSGELSMAQVRRLLAADRSAPEPEQRAVHRVWPDFPVQPLINRSARTVKADASHRAFACQGSDVVWAVLDSGIDATHPHFAAHATLTAPEVRDLHRDFTGANSPLTDAKGHGTHVAGIIAGGLPTDWPADPARLCVVRQEHDPDTLGPPRWVGQPAPDPTALRGIAPATRLVSLKAVGSEAGPLADRVSRVIEALTYIRRVNAGNESVRRIHGVNISLGHEFDPRWFACGHSPLCREVDKLVRSGVVVVVAAGNTGYGTLRTEARVTELGLAMTINDPGNAERAITVGSTHREQPHTYGVSYFSSKGPTGDGRPKPDLLAPGERILSCAAGQRMPGPPEPGQAVYVEDTGTSMAAPHVSGAVAAFLSVRPEFIGEPERVKEIFMASATSLGRERYFQGAGLLDLLRALQSV